MEVVRKNKFTLLLIIFALFSACRNNQNMEGLWVVQQVKVGDEILTPNARWTRLNQDSTQQSGNGWFQHSYGTWKFDNNTNKLSIFNENGLIDKNEPFVVSLNNNQMTWSRMEEGQNIEVKLERSNKLPHTYSDQVLGLWQLENSTGNDALFGALNKELKLLFLRWDKRFVIYLPDGRINGVYNVNGHKPEIEFIPYGDNQERSFWSMEIEKDKIELKLLNNDNSVVHQFKRIYEFPD